MDEVAADAGLVVLALGGLVTTVVSLPRSLVGAGAADGMVAESGRGVVAARVAVLLLLRSVGPALVAVVLVMNVGAAEALTEEEVVTVVDAGVVDVLVEAVVMVFVTAVATVPAQWGLLSMAAPLSQPGTLPSLLRVPPVVRPHGPVSGAEQELPPPGLPLLPPVQVSPWPLLQLGT